MFIKCCNTNIVLVLTVCLLCVVHQVTVMALRLNQLAVESESLFTPPVNEIVKVLNDGLKNHFTHVEVEFVECPDLTGQPFTLASPGLNGNAKLVEVGGPAFLLPMVNRSKLYDITDIANASSVNPTFIIGAGAGPFDHEKTNCEGIYNLKLKNGEIIHQDSKISKINNTDLSTPIQKTLTQDVKNFGLLGNFFISEGNSGKVLKIHVKKRTGNLDFIASIRTVLADHYGPKSPVGLGGVFLMKEGKAKTHVMPDFSTKPLNTDEELNKWLKFYNMSAPLISVGTLVTAEFANLDLRLQHFHLFSHHGEAGHYHIDTTPNEVEYLGYFNIAREIIRVDKPAQSAGFGKD